MKKLKLFTLGMVMCLSLAMLTGCGNADNNQNEENTTTEDGNKDKKDNNNSNNKADVNDTTTGTDTPMATGNGSSVGEDIVDTVDNVGTDIVDGVTDVGRDLTGDDGTGNNASAQPATTDHATATP